MVTQAFNVRNPAAISRPQVPLGGRSAPAEADRPRSIAVAATVGGRRHGTPGADGLEFSRAWLLYLRFESASGDDRAAVAD